MDNAITESKICPVCKSVFYRRQYCQSDKVWGKRIHCSRICAGHREWSDEYYKSRLMYLLSKTVISTTGCMEHTLGKGEHGYGQCFVAGKYDRLHRQIYRLAVAPIPDGKHILHKCDNPKCINPEHLYIGDHQDNMADMVERGRHLKSITLEDKSKIIEMAKERVLHRIIAEKFNISRCRVSEIAESAGIRRKYNPLTRHNRRGIPEHRLPKT